MGWDGISELGLPTGSAPLVSAPLGSEPCVSSDNLLFPN